MMRVLLLCVLLAVVSAQSSLVTQMMMDNHTHFKIEWKQGLDVQYSMYNFKTGDVIQLDWTGNHDAVVVPDASDPCATDKSAFIKTLAGVSSPGSVNYTTTAATPNDFWIICTVGSHCESGNQKIMFMREGASHSANTTMTPSSPPSSSSPMPNAASSTAAMSAIVILVGAVFMMFALI